MAESSQLFDNKELFFELIGELFQPTQAASRALVLSIHSCRVDVLPEFKKLVSRLVKLHDIDPATIPDELNGLESVLKTASALIRTGFSKKPSIRKMLTKELINQLLSKIAEFAAAMQQFRKSLIVLIQKLEK